MKISELLIRNDLVLAPMAGYTDAAFRSVCRDFGAGLTVTEMVSAKALLYKSEKTEALLYRETNDFPSAVQLFGHEPEIMAECVSYPSVAAYEIIDINMGCPMKKIVSNGDGSALVENVELAKQIVAAVKKAAKDKPVSVKFRTGVKDSSKVAYFASAMADAGADMMTVHLRTREQMYSGHADYSLISSVVKAAKNVPVTANGDVNCREKYLICKDAGAFAVAVGRGALGRPYIFSEIAGKEFRFDLLKTITKQAEIMLKTKSDRVCANELKKHVAFYLKGLKNAKQTVVKVQSASSVKVITALISDFLANNL